jgi:hypothetical protein
MVLAAASDIYGSFRCRGLFRLTSLVMLAAFGGTLGVALGTRSVIGTLVMLGEGSQEEVHH